MLMPTNPSLVQKSSIDLLIFFRRLGVVGTGWRTPVPSNRQSAISVQGSST
jgi:hypothetical protein